MSVAKASTLSSQKRYSGIKAKEEDSPSKRRYGSLAADSAKVRKSLLDKYNTGGDETTVTGRSGKEAAVKPPHRVPRMEPAPALTQVNSPAPQSPREVIVPAEEDRKNEGSVKRVQTKRAAPKELEEPELEGGSLHLVPCRWSLSGWKYVKMDPGDHKYFNSPHRVNGQGIYTGPQSPSNAKKMQAILLNGDATTFEQRQWGTQNEEKLSSTYSKHFSPAK